MPNKPSKSDTQSSYMSKCIKLLKGEGKSTSKAKELCAAIWYQSKKRK
jgi:hypothetical protein